MNNRLIPVQPFLETLEGGCGPAVLKMVLEYYGVKLSEKELYDRCQATEDLGTPPEMLKEVAEELGFNVEVKEHATFEDIQQWLRKGVPPIVDWFSRGRTDYDASEVADGHYSAVVGLDGQYIYLQDPELGSLRNINKEKFLTVWFDFRGKYIQPEELIIRLLISIYK